MVRAWHDVRGGRSRHRSSDPHGELMRDLAPRMGETVFVRWTVNGSAGRPSWREASARLASSGSDRSETP